MSLLYGFWAFGGAAMGGVNVYWAANEGSPGGWSPELCAACAGPWLMLAVFGVLFLARQSRGN